MLEVRNIRVRSYDIDHLDLFWEVVPTYEDPLDYTFVVEKSNSEFGPFLDLTGEFRNKYRLRDNTVRGQHSHYRKHYYRIRVTHSQTSATATYPEEGYGVALAAPPDLYAMEMACHERLALKELKGREVIIFPKKHFGQRCSCFDQVTGRRVRSNCRTCYDTGWVGGFDTPIRTYAQIQTPSEVTAVTPHGKIVVQNAKAKLSNYPELEEGWIIVEQENKRWRVGAAIEKYKLSRAVIRQEASLYLVEKGDIEYTLPMNIDSPEDYTATPDRNYRNPQDLGTAGNTVL
jgi:hypothetical protein